MRILNITALALLMVTMSGCQQMGKTKAELTRNRNQDYLSSTIIAPLRVPEGLSMPRENETYPLPAQIPALSSLKPVPLAPPGFGKLV